MTTTMITVTMVMKTGNGKIAMRTILTPNAKMITMMKRLMTRKETQRAAKVTKKETKRVTKKVTRKRMMRMKMEKKEKKELVIVTKTIQTVIA